MTKFIDINESKQIQKDILSFVDDFCMKHNIRYSLYGGTLIGAIRHHGFIPWDDDIDILVPREDYHKLVCEFKDERGIYILHSLENDKDYEFPYAKIEDSRTFLEENTTTRNYGIAIDVFPCDFVGDTKEDAIKFVKRREIVRLLFISKLVRLSKGMRLSKYLILLLLKVIMLPVSKRSLALLRSNLSQKKKKKTTFCADVVLVSNYGIKEIIPSDLFDNLIDVDFENKSFKAFSKYDTYLNSVFGDYMKLPPEDERKSPHIINKIYWK